MGVKGGGEGEALGDYVAIVQPCSVECRVVSSSYKGSRIGTCVTRSKKCWKDHESKDVAMSRLSTGYALAYSSSFKFEDGARVDIPLDETRSPMHDSSDHTDVGEPVYVALARI